MLKYPTPNKLICTKEIILSKASSNHFLSEKAKEILLAAKNTFGIDDTYDTYSKLIKKYISQIKFIQKYIAELDEKSLILCKRYVQL